MNIADVIKSIKYEILFGETNRAIKGISCDSRRCQDGYIFVAIKGFESDGHNFIGNAIENGAICVIYEAGRGVDFSSFQNRNITFIKVKDTRRVFSYLCNMFYDFPSKRVDLIGITGTNGKTTITYLTEKLLNNTAVIGTVNYRYKSDVFKGNNTTPLSCDINFFIKKFIENGAENVVIEVSSHGIDLNRVDYLDFNIGVFSNLSGEHLDYHKNMENYFNAKKRFFTEILKNSKKSKPIAIINIDDEYGRRLVDEIDYKLVTYSIKNSSADVYCKEYSLTLAGSTIKLSFLDKSITTIKTNLIGEYNISNIVASMAILYCLGKEVRSSLNLNINIPGRLERIVKNRNIFVDYAHTDDALENVLSNLIKIKPKHSKIITVFGCGGDRDKIKRPKMGYIAAKYSDFVVVTSDNPRTENPVLIIDDILEGIKKGVEEKLIDENNYRVIPDREDAIKMSINMAKENDIVLIAGKGHEDYQIIGKEKKYFSDKEIALKYIK